MTDAMILSDDDIRKLLAEHFDVEEKDIIRAKYSWIVRKKVV